ncbi:hypothetical protein Tco_0044564 [Tanacetum coccineum]
MRYSEPRSSHYLLLPHPLQIHQDMFLSLIRRRSRKRTLRIPRTIQLITLRDDADDEDEDEDEDEKEEEKEHPAPADSIPPVHQVKRLLSLTIPPLSPLTPLSSPLLQIPSPLLPSSPPASVLPALPLPTSTPPLQLLSSDRRADGPEIILPPRKRLGIDLGLRCEVGESSAAAAAARPIGGRRADYGFVDTMDAETSQRRAEEVSYMIRDTWVDPRDAAEDVALTTLEGVNTRVTELAAYHYETARLLDQEALVSQEAWGRSIEVSYMARSEIMALRSIVMSQQTVISQLQAADCRRAAWANFDIDAVTTRTGDHSTGTGDSTARTAGTLWRSSTASCTGGGR